MLGLSHLCVFVFTVCVRVPESRRKGTFVGEPMLGPAWHCLDCQ